MFFNNIVMYLNINTFEIYKIQLETVYFNMIYT